MKFHLLHVVKLGCLKDLATLLKGSHLTYLMIHHPTLFIDLFLHKLGMIHQKDWTQGNSMLINMSQIANT